MAAPIPAKLDFFCSSLLRFLGVPMSRILHATVGWTAVTLLALVPGAPATADTVELARGGNLTGKVKRYEDFVIVQVDDDVQVAIRASRVRGVVTSDQLRRYRELAATVGEDAEKHYQLARWCVTGDNVPGKSEQYKNFHLRRAIEIDPEHSGARAALGFTKDGGQWVLRSKLMRDRGMVLRAGDWEAAELAAIEDVQDTTNVAVKKWIKDVSRMTAMVLRNPSSPKGQESLAALQAINDPTAAVAIAKQLRDSREKGNQPRSLRMIWIKLLGKFRNSASTEALVRAGIEERDASIREAALDQLLQYGGSSAQATYLPMLKSNDNKLVNRAARALSWFPDPELALTYVDALVTEHKTVTAPGPGINTSFSADGGGGLSTGGKPIEKIDLVRNPSVLSLLKSVEPDVDHGYDETAWRWHFANKRSSFSGDLRRDF